MADHPASAPSKSADHHHPAQKEGKSPNFIESIFHHKSPRHHKETHGTSDDIDEDTPIEEVKGPNVFQRIKEEVEAIVEAFTPKKGSKDHK